MVDDKIKRMDNENNVYNVRNLVYGSYPKTIELFGQPITYHHTEVFLLKENDGEDRKFVRLTGYGVKGDDLSVVDTKDLAFGQIDLSTLFVKDGGITYEIVPSETLFGRYLSMNYATIDNIKECNNEKNSFAMYSALDEVLANRAIDEMYEDSVMDIE